MFEISWMYCVAEFLGIMVDVPFRDLTDEDRDIVYNSPEVMKVVAIESITEKVFDLNCIYCNTHRAMEKTLNNVSTEKDIQRVERYLIVRPCEECGDTRFCVMNRSTRLNGMDLARAVIMTISALMDRVTVISGTMPGDTHPIAESICSQFLATGRRLMDLDYLLLYRVS